MNFNSSVITLTFGDAAENHVGMEIRGARGAVGSGFTVSELEALAAAIPGAELVRLEPPAEAVGTGVERAQAQQAAVLVLRGALDADAHKTMFEEQAALEHDKKARMYGRVVNKKMRWNLCFDDVAQEPDYAAGKGRVVAMSSIPHTEAFLRRMEALLGPKAVGLKGEGNYYYDLKKCGIGWHGDTERRKVVAVRLGDSEMPIQYQWYHKGEPKGEILSIPLRGGDVYVMSEKAVGNDWKHSSKWTLRHATGAH
jgi:alkylated DNA repair dioxygenase AlkB